MGSCNRDDRGFPDRDRGIGRVGEPLGDEMNEALPAVPSETVHVMLDLETMGTRPGAIIRAIGAVKFTEAAGIIDRIYFRVTSESCERVGMHFDGGTVNWWLAQDDAARTELLRPGTDIRNALTALAYFCTVDAQKKEKLNVWGCGATFDPPLAGYAYVACGLPLPWTHLDVRCYRTLKALFPDVRNREKTAHHALLDAVWQAEHAVAVLRFLRASGQVMNFGARETGVDAVPGGAPMSPGIGQPTGPQNFAAGYSAEDLVGRAVYYPGNWQPGKLRWSAVASAFAVGSTSAIEICRACGADPETVKDGVLDA